MPKPTSIHHPRVGVVLELDQVVGRIAEDEGAVHLHQSFEAGAEVAEHLDLPLHAEMMQRLEVGGFTKGHTEVTRIKVEGLATLGGGLAEVAYHLIAEEVERDPIRVPPGQLAPELTDIEVLGIVEVVRRYRQMKGVPGLSHTPPPSKRVSVSARRPRRMVSSPSTAVAATLPRLTLGPMRFTK